MKSKADPMISSGSIECGLCGRLIGLSEPSEECEEPGCTEKICTRCWTILNRRQCLEHRPKAKGETIRPHGFASNPSSVQSRPVTTPSGAIDVALAKRLETMFLERVESMVRTLNHLSDPESKTKVSLRSIIGRKTQHDEKAGLLLHSDCRVDPRVLNEQFPLNRALTFDLKKNVKRLLDDFDRVRLEARFHSRLEKLVVDGYDQGPQTPLELTAAIGSVIDQSKRDGILRIVAYFSPTGWEHDAIRLVVSEGDSPTPTLSSPHASFLLVGPKIYDLVFNKKDKRALLFAPLFRGELPQEQLERCVKFIQGRLIGLRHLTAGEVAEGLSLDQAVVVEAMQKIADEEEDWEFKNVRGVGPTLTRRV